MRKYLINCSFGYYPGGVFKKHKGYALIVQSEEEKPDLFWLIYDELVKLNFEMQERAYIERSDIVFTSQPL